MPERWTSALHVSSLQRLITAVPAVASSDSELCISLTETVLLLHIRLVSGPLQCGIMFVKVEPDAGPR